MNYFKILILAVIVLVSSSCNDFLDVNPRTEVPRDQLFETQNGFVEALAGVYIALKKNGLYGKELTMTTMEHLVSNWDVTPNTTEYRLNLFEYTDATIEAKFAAIYSSMYNVIAQVNAILEKIDEANDKGVFSSQDMYETIKGECYAIRAFCHSDLLRLFGPVPTQAGSDPVLPYMTQLTIEIMPHLTFEQFGAKLKEDLNSALELLANDPIISSTVSATRSNNGFFAFRDVRFNYYAVKAILARVHLWYGEKDEAYSAAKEVIGAMDDENTSKFPLGDDSYSDDDFLCSCENILGLYYHKLEDTYTDLFADGTLKKGGKTLSQVVNELYGNTGSDNRELHLWEIKTDEYGIDSPIIRKYSKKEGKLSGKDLKVIPLLRISEMYFVVMECATDIDEANKYWADFQHSRNNLVSELPVDIMSKSIMLAHEYRKEFYAEGQAFYAYKRLNMSNANMLWVPGYAKVDYVVPLPKTELVHE